MNKFQKWKQAGQPYQAGISLLLAIGGKEALATELMLKNNPGKLAAELGENYSCNVELDKVIEENRAAVVEVEVLPEGSAATVFAIAFDAQQDIAIDLAKEKASLFGHRCDRANQLINPELTKAEAAELVRECQLLTREMGDVRQREIHFKKTGELPPPVDNTKSTKIDIDKLEDPKEIQRLIRNSRRRRSQAREYIKKKPNRAATYRNKEINEDKLIEKLEARLNQIAD